MRWLLVLLCGCNQIFGLAGVGQRDAAFFDAPLDARPVCPTDGASAPTFRSTFHQIPSAPRCRYPSVAEDGTVMALCTNNGEPWIGTVLGGLAPIQFDPPIVGYAWQMLRLAPEGDFALAYAMTPTIQAQVFALARNPGAATWTLEGAVSGLAVTTTLLSTSTPSRRENGVRHLVTIVAIGGIEQVLDFTGDHTSWSQIGAMYPLADTGPTTIFSPPSLTADGLRLVVDGLSATAGGAYYLERADPAQPFGTARLIDTLPGTGVQNPFMSNDCGELYFDALETEFYVYQ